MTKITATMLLWSIAATSAAASSVLDLSNTRLDNPTAYISAQCYTKTTDASGAVFNPCFTCHTAGRIPNYLDDHDLQLNYSLPEAALRNPWRNLWLDRNAAVAAISDETILNWVRTDNYHTADGRIALAQTLNAPLPPTWDHQGDGRWDGYRPDAYFHFDNQGFDRDPAGGYTGWRAFAYHPFPGTFWPTNGSTDDVLIRLAAPLRENRTGQFDPLIYRINLALVEAFVRRQDIAIDPVDERVLGVDVNGDGRLTIAQKVALIWPPRADRQSSLVGRAQELQHTGALHLAAGLFPEGTEFLHSVRYLDLDAAGQVQLAPRMKELRYARKTSWYTYAELKGINTREGAERALDPDMLKNVPGDFERGMFTQGWIYQGFIEAQDGQLRPQSQEETLFCMGCHGGIGATTDTIFSFPRRLGADAAQHGWFHWSQYGLAGIPEPQLADGTFEYSRYLMVNGAGDEFRANTEVIERFFDTKGQLRPSELKKLHQDISVLLLPSAARALALNKAYWLIVQAQSFRAGRDASITPPRNVHTEVLQNQPTGIINPIIPVSK
ncbi:hypothetical protein [Chromatium okenii]|uniref:hypothetical protein n=1 Tax=Chromatium okenii TaxID=61644 RepID=UPI001903EA0C|nr:hypothetical protein [Chromatium okenii]